jgi:hypothetical protein
VTRAVHLAMPCPHPHFACAGPVPCKGVDICRPRKWARTTDPAEVTCAKCLISPVWYRRTATSPGGTT